MIRRSAAPEARLASMNVRVVTSRTVPFTIRTYAGIEEIPTATMRFSRLGPVAATMVRASRIPGSASRGR
jgi:hypothetical protein